LTTKVLIVDDDWAIRMLIKTFLEFEDEFEVVGEADSAAAALKAAAEKLPDLVTMDYDMPGSNGAECIRDLRAQWPGIHVLAVTSAGGQEAQSMLDAGAYAKINKAHMETVVPALYKISDLRKMEADRLAAAAEGEEPFDLATHFDQLRSAIAAMEDDAAWSIEEQKKNLAERVELVVALRAVRVAARNPRYTPEEALHGIVALASAILEPEQDPR
jgi:NarL family two-component system response regulator LiaR